MVLALGFGGQLLAQPVTTGKALSPADMEKRVTDLQAQVRTDNQRVQHLQALARKEKDVIKLGCVNDKFVKLKPQMNIFDTAVTALGSATPETQQTTFSSVTTAADAVHKIREEADRCVGEVEIESETQNGYTKPEIIDDPTTSVPFGGTESGVEPPGYASPFS